MIPLSVIPSILAASRAAFSPLPIPTAATGTPGGICTTDSKESRFPGELLEAQGMPMTGLRVWAATTPGSAAERPARAMKISASEFLMISTTRSGVLWAEATKVS